MTWLRIWRPGLRWSPWEPPRSPTRGCPRSSRSGGIALADVVVALDFEAGSEALALVGRLDGLEWVKVGSILFLAEGPRLIGELKERGLSVFLDLKWHDIPNSVAGAVRVAADLGVDVATVHALGGERMLRAAQAASGHMRIAAVSVLTSHSAQGYWDTVGRGGNGSLGGEVVRLAELGKIQDYVDIELTVVGVSELGKTRFNTVFLNCVA
ncbi:MAG: orotidine 5'-phosphate decarboxylase, partial [Gemmatimonadetes bacterium]|nr:orotidine 5'-phosphate decarboxylase [Gemmatimonadota bacterium]